MGQKVNPIGFRLGINRTWESVWCADKREYAKLLHEDFAIRRFIHKRLSQAFVSKVLIERSAGKARVFVHTARPGVVIGKKGKDIAIIRAQLQKFTKNELSLNVVEIKKPEIDAQLVADSVAKQLERRIAFRRAMKRAVQGAMRLGAQGIRINCSGRLAGADIARTEWYREGRVSLHTLRADVDYALSSAYTTYGVCGIKVWIFKGEILDYEKINKAADVSIIK